MVKEAHTLGMRVAGHVPAFSDANTVIEQGYDEVTHINQFMLGWVLEAGEDTRTLLRVTALKRMPDLDLKSERVQHTVNLMVERKVAIDPTLAIHEEATQNRDGLLPPGADDYLDHMPIGYQRSAKKAMVDASAPYDDQAYRGAFEKIVATVQMLNDRGVFIVPGTDLGGSFKYHRKLELYQRAGMTAADILARATLEMARYLGQTRGWARSKKASWPTFFSFPEIDQGSESHQAHQHGGEGRHRVFSKRDLSKVRDRAVRECAECDEMTGMTSLPAKFSCRSGGRAYHRRRRRDNHASSFASNSRSFCSTLSTSAARPESSCSGARGAFSKFSPRAARRMSSVVPSTHHASRSRPYAAVAFDGVDRYPASRACLRKSFYE